MANLTNLNNKFLVQTGGNVGINKTSPEEKLDIAGSVLISNNEFYKVEKTDGTNYKIAGLTNGNVIQIGAIDYTSAGTIFAGGDNIGITTGGAAGTTRIKIDSSGNVGIGTISPQKNLQIFQTEGGVGAKHATIRLGGYSTVGPDIAAYRVTGNSNDQGLIFSTYDATNGTVDTMTLTNAGNVGIGTTSPAQPLSVHGNLLVRTTNADGNKNRMQCIVGGSSDAANLYLYYGNSGDGTVSVRLNAQGDSYLNGGNVGIGVTSPGARLHVDNSAADAIIRLSKGSSTIGNIDFVNEGNRFSIQDDGTRRLVIDTSGNVGIGTSNPTAKLEVENGDIWMNRNNASSNYYLRLNRKAGQDGGILLYGDSVLDWQILNQTGTRDLNFYSYGTSSVVATIQNSTGNVGIGITSPGAKLEVKGNFKIERSSIAEASEITMEAGEFDIKAHSAYKMRFFTGGSERMRIDTDGNVGIGTTSPANKLHVEGDTNGGVQIEVDNQNNGNASYAGLYLNGQGNNFYIKNWGDSVPTRTNSTEFISTTSGSSFIFSTVSTERMTITSGGSTVLHDGIDFAVNAPTNRGSLILAGASAPTNFGGIEFHTNSGGGAGYGTKIYSSDATWGVATRNNSSSFTTRFEIAGSTGNAYFTGGLGIGVTTPYARLNSYGAIISQSAENDPEVTLVTNSVGTVAGGTLRVMQGFSRSGVAGDEIVFTYAATSWKAWSLDYTFASTQGVTQGIIGGYWNNSGGQTNVENIDSHQTTVAVTHGGTGNQNNIVTFTFNAPGTHINCSFVYTQSGGDGSPRGDRTTITYTPNTP